MQPILSLLMIAFATRVASDLTCPSVGQDFCWNIADDVLYPETYQPYCGAVAPFDADQLRCAGGMDDWVITFHMSESWTGDQECLDTVGCLSCYLLFPTCIAYDIYGESVPTFCESSYYAAFGSLPCATEAGVENWRGMFHDIVVDQPGCLNITTIMLDECSNVGHSSSLASVGYDDSSSSSSSSSSASGVRYSSSSHSSQSTGDASNSFYVDSGSAYQTVDACIILFALMIALV
jgi:hypothetical protein